MQAVVRIAKALSDPARLRVLRALRGGELCLCHCIALLELSPSTVSKHLDVLHQAGLVLRRKNGRWCYFRRAAGKADPAVRGALRWVDATLDDGAETERDAERVAELREADLKQLSCCYKEA